MTVRWLVDAMNVIGTRPDGWWRDRHAAMVRLVEQVERWAEEGGEEVTVVLEREPSPRIDSQSVRVAYALRAGADSADDEIVRLISADEEPDSVRVVTSDKRLSERVRAHGAAIEPAEAFRRRIEDASEASGPRSDQRVDGD